jgi:hypothetical protein
MGHGVFHGSIQCQQFTTGPNDATLTNNAVTKPISRSIRHHTPEDAIRGATANKPATVQWPTAGSDVGARLAAERCQRIRSAWPEAAMEPFRRL